jgi:hypothetical protein
MFFRGTREEKQAWALVSLRANPGSLCNFDARLQCEDFDFLTGLWA